MRAFILVLLGAVFVQVRAAEIAGDPVAIELQAQVESLVQSGPVEIHSEGIALPQLIYDFYSQRSYKPAWTDARSAGELRRALQDSLLDGLDPGDYHLPALQKLAAEIASGSASSTTLVQYEILCTDALMRLGYHLTFGKVDPESFDSQWNYARTLKGVDIARSVESMVTSGDIYGRLEALKPTRRLYVTLKQTLAHYRAIEAAGGWMSVSAGEAIKPGSHNARVIGLRARLAASGDLEATNDSSSDLYDPPLEAATRRFQERMGLVADGVVGARTIEELNVPVSDRIRQLRINLDRGRVLLHDLPQEFVVVNIAAYWIYLVRGEDVVWNARVQVGKTYRRTPMFRSDITYLVWNPTWTVPPGIIRNDILPQASRDPASITRRGLNVLDSRGNKVDPQSVDWSKFKSGNIPYTLRQDPGPANALGRVKFMFSNPYSVYLHDTPSNALFEATDRAFSSGCVRVERPIELAMLLLKDPQTWSNDNIARTIESRRTQNVTLPVKMPLLLAYWTAWVDGQGLVNFRRDIYGQDAQWEAGLKQGFAVRKRPLVASE